MLFKQEDKRNVYILGEHPEMLIYPEVGKTYNVFDDGKVRWTRLEHWKIIEKIDLDNDKVDQDLIDLIAEEINSCYWLYAPEQTVIYKALRVDAKDPKPERSDDGGFNLWDYNYFLTTKQNTWFSLGFACSGLLDVDGCLTACLEAQE